MTAQLDSSLDELSFSDLLNRERFFGEDQSERIKRNYEIGRELRSIGQPGKSCDVNLFMGFFFDGTHFFKVYVLGVGTPFRQVNDSGTGKDALLGNATALYGERRILWALTA